MQVTLHRDVAATPERTFAAATSFPEAATFIRAITRIEMLTQGPVGVGTRFRETRKMFGREATEEFEILEFEPPRRFVMGCENHGCRYRSEFRFTPVSGGTRMEMDFRGEGLTFFTRLMGKLMAPLAKSMMKECSKDLEDIAKRAEGLPAG